MLKRSFIALLVVFCVFFAFRASAEIGSGDIVLTVNPSYPKANQSVTATLSSFSTDLNAARITWTIDGEEMLSGVGKKTFSFNVGATGFATNLEAKIETLSGSVISKKSSILPTDIDMLWEAYDTYSPPFYKGKTLAPAEGMIKVVAFPNAQNIAGFNYKWKLDGTMKTEASGYEKNYYIYKNSYLEDKNIITTNVSDLFGNGIGLGSITITPVTEPKVLFYRKDQKIGVNWDSALMDNFSINPAGDTIVAEPYFIFPRDLGSKNISFKWLLNGEDTPLQNPINNLSVKLVSGKSGTANIKVIINNTKTLFESVTKELNVGF